MKYISIIIFFFISSLIPAQSINQFDSNGNRHGIWKKNFEGTNQVRYQGEFYHGKEIGLFKFYKYLRKRSVLTATKQFNDKDNIADVTFLSSRGKVISEGQMNGKLYIGKWTYYHNNSTKVMTLETYNEKGELHGKRYVFYKDSQIAEEAYFVNGSKEGLSTWFSKKGVALKVFNYENNELHGLAKFFDEFDVLLTEGSYKRGKKTGIWNYYSKGKLVKQKDFTNKPKYIKKQ